MLTDAVGTCAVVEGIGINEISKIVSKIFAFIEGDYRAIILTLLLLIPKVPLVCAGEYNGSVVYDP